MTLDELHEHLKTSPHWFLANYRGCVLRELISTPEHSNMSEHRFLGVFATNCAPATSHTARLLFSLRNDKPSRSNWLLVPYHEALTLRMQGWAMYTRADTTAGSETCQAPRHSKSP